MVREWHVSRDGHAGGSGWPDSPFKTIGEAAERAEPGDELIVHDGTYRERIDPPRGGTAESPIVYRAATDAAVTITGSELIEDWVDDGYGCWCTVLPNTLFGEYNPYADRIRGDWFDDHGRDHHTGAVYVNGVAVPEAASLAKLREADTPGWVANVASDTTTIWAAVGDADPRTEIVEINVRPTVFYPSEPGRDHITVRGFTMCHAATQWAPPTTEQIGLLGTHWSKGWVITDNVIHHSRCTGMTLGKYGTSVDDTGATADRYNTTIREAIEQGWEPGTIGGHVVHDNIIHHCEQAGIVGSMGGAFCEITDNHIHHINVEAQFGGAELAGIKLHGAVDTTLAGNRIHHAYRGIWLDWMTQGTRVTRNYLAENRTEDLFVEVNHGPYIIDTNVLLSGTGIRDWSQGGAYLHNLIAGAIQQQPERNRETPFLHPHSTDIAGLSDIIGGDNRFFNNVFVGSKAGLVQYDDVADIEADGNVYLDGATPTRHEDEPIQPDSDASLEWDSHSATLAFEADKEWVAATTGPVTTPRLGTTRISTARFSAPAGTALVTDRDFVGEIRNDQPTPGPFEAIAVGNNEFNC